MNIGELSVGLKIDEGSLKSMTTKVQTESKKQGDAMEKEVGARGVKAFKEVDESAKGFASTLSNIKGLLATAFGITAIVSFSKTLLTLGNNLEQAKISFTTMLGSAKAADQLLRDLSNFAKNTPFEIQGIRESAKQLLAMGVSQQQLLPTLKSLGDVAAGLSVPLDQLARNYGQVVSRGKLAGTELRDFTTAGVPLLEQLSKQMGKSTAELAVLGEKGLISSAEVVKAFQIMSSDGGRFANLMEKQSRSLGGVWANLKDTMTLLAEKIGTALVPAAKGLIAIFQTLINFVQSAEGKAVLMGVAVGALTLGVITLIPVIGALAASLATAAAAGTVLAGALAFVGWPVTLLVAGLALLGGGAFYAYEAFNGLTGATAELQGMLNDLEDQQKANKKAFDDGTLSAEEYKKMTEENSAAQADLKLAIDEVNNGTATYGTIKDRINNLKKIADVDAYNRETKVIEVQIAALKDLIRIKSINAKQALSALKAVQESQKNEPQTNQGSTTLLMDATAAFNNSQFTPEAIQAQKEIKIAQEQVNSLDEALKKVQEARKVASTALPPVSGAGGAGKEKKDTQELTYEIGKLKDAYSELKKDKKDLEDLEKKYSEASLKRLAETKKALNEIGDKIKQNEKDYQESLSKIAKETEKKTADANESYVRGQAVKQVDVEKQLKDVEDQIAQEKKLAELKGTQIDTDTLLKQKKLEDDIAEAKLKQQEQTSKTSASERLALANRLTDLQADLTKLKNGKDFDENTQKIIDLQTKRNELEQQLKDTKSNLADLSGTEAGNLSDILETERQRASLSDEKRAEFDYKAKIAQIAAERKAQEDAAKAKFEEDNKALERQKAIYDFFANKTNLTPLQLAKIQKSDQFKDATGEEQNLIIKLGNELIALTQQKEKKFALEQELQNDTQKLNELTTQKAIANVQKLKKEYQDLIAEINTAIAAQNQLSAGASGGGRWFAEGGYTGDGGVHDVAGVVHKGEYVLSQDMIGKLPGIVPALEGVRSGNVDQSRNVSINGPITMNDQLDFEQLIRRAKFVM